MEIRNKSNSGRVHASISTPFVTYNKQKCIFPTFFIHSDFLSCDLFSKMNVHTFVVELVTRITSNSFKL